MVARNMTTKTLNSATGYQENMTGDSMPMNTATGEAKQPQRDVDGDAR